MGSLNRIILEKNTPLPCESSQTFYTMRDGQTHIEVSITQGEDVDPQYVNNIATYKFELPPDRPAGRPIKVTYSYDVNQCMHCKFEDIESGCMLEVDLSMNKEGEMTTEDSPPEKSQVESVKVE